jgi:methylenetetrahydrofolate reductase (NADPH)
MIRIFRNDIEDPDRFVVTLELVPGSESLVRTVDTVMGMATDAYADGRISAVSITDNPGGNPSLSPDVLGYQIFKLGMDVIVHFTCRDANRVGIESRALQLAMMGMKNILALTGDYSGKGFGGQGAPVFDLDSVNLTCMLSMLSKRLLEDGDPEEFFTGCAVSPFKSTRGEGFAQYAKLCKKVSAGAKFIITQLGYDAGKFQELLLMQKKMGISAPTLGSLYYLTPRIAQIMNSGKIPGAVVTDRLKHIVEKEWGTPKQGQQASIERTAALGAVLKGLGFRGIHIGGIQRNFDTVGKILDKMVQFEPQWKDIALTFNDPQPIGFYFFTKDPATGISEGRENTKQPAPPKTRRRLFKLLQVSHDLFFSFDSPFSSQMKRICVWADQNPFGELLVAVAEDAIKKIFLDCRKCGDCAIAHTAFLCPESQCPKHIRNGPCGGSRQGMCEVFPENRCIWVRAYNRLATLNRSAEMATGCVPPRMWELNNTSSWINFHLLRDHQGAATEITRFCSAASCRQFRLQATIRDMAIANPSKE